MPSQISDSRPTRRPDERQPARAGVEPTDAPGGPGGHAGRPGTPGPGGPTANPFGSSIPDSPAALSELGSAQRDDADGSGLTALPLPASPTLISDASGRVVRVNAALLRMLGLDPRAQGVEEAVLGRPVGQVVIGPDGDARLVRPDGALARVRVVRWTLPELGAGYRVPAGLRAVMLVDATDVPLPVTSRDDTERQLAELRTLARVGNWSYDLRTGGLHRAPSLVELYRQIGIAPDAQPGGPIELEQVALLCASLRDPARRRGSEGHHVEHRTAGPSERVLSCRATVERNADGVPVRLVGTVQDVTERRTAEQRVTRATQRYLDLVSIAPVGVGVFNRSGQLVDANGALCALLGVPGETLRGVSARSLAVDPTSGPTGSADLAFLRPVRPGAAHGYRIPQFAVRRGDGTSVWCELSVTGSIGDDGRQFWLVVFTDISERRRAADVLRIAGTHDELTRLPNRSSVTARLGRLLAAPDRHKLAVLCCDLDDFKRVNTALGHAAGDQVLITLAARLQRELPIGCSPARLSGDEFVVVCDDLATVGGVTRLAETVAALLREPVSVDGQSVRVSAAIGVATPGDIIDGGALGGSSGAEDLLRFADAAMYEAKGNGAGQLGFVTADTASSANQQLRLEDELREAIAGDQLVLHYQPVVDVDGAVRSAEALIRWPHPERGMLFPGAFIPVAERGGLLRELDRWVLRTATKEAAAWPAHNRRPVGVAVNLAGLLPDDVDFLPLVRSALAESGLPGDRLVLELVETSLVSLPTESLATMSELADQGVRFAVDDFGTGYSSLSRIKELPAQIVKVDRTFVSGISTDPADFAVARAVVQMASAMGRYCVAEGIETPEQFHALRELGVDAYQGWLFAKAMDPRDFRVLLAGSPMPVPSGTPVTPPDALATQALPSGARLDAAVLAGTGPAGADVAGTDLAGPAPAGPAPAVTPPAGFGLGGSLFGVGLHLPPAGGPDTAPLPTGDPATGGQPGRPAGDGSPVEHLLDGGAEPDGLDVPPSDRV
ncbi:MAG TPA: EAL domain-containing protein [Pseudonocardia sp.]